MRKYLLTFLFAMFCYVLQAQSPSEWTLEQCLERALQENISLKQSSLLVQSNEINLRQSRANRIPTLSANGNQNFTFGRSADPFTNRFETESISSGNTSISSNITLFSGLQIYNTIERNKLNLEASRNDLQSTQNEILLQVAAGYVQILQDKELLRSAEVQLNSIKEQRDRTKKLVDAEVSAVGDLLELDAQVATEENNVVTAENPISAFYFEPPATYEPKSTRPFCHRNP